MSTITETNGKRAAPVEAALGPLDLAHAYIKRYVSLADVQTDALTLWAAHSWAMDAADVTPYIAIQSVGPGSGKTTLLEVLEQIVAAPWLTARTTSPALVRKIGKDHPTLLLDETDALFTGGNAQQILRGALNAGYKRGGMIAYAQGGGVQEIDVFCPKAFAGLTDLPATVKDRSIPIVMRKKTAFDKTERMRRRDVRQAAEIPRMLLLRFGVKNVEKLAQARPRIPESLDDRAADVWEPLLAIADLAGGSWPERARKAATELMKDRTAAVMEAASFRLLKAVAGLFDDLGTDRLKTETVLDSLLAQDEWVTMDNRPLDARLLADTLRAFGVTPCKIRFGRTTAQGYMRHTVSRALGALIGDDVPENPEEEVID